MPFEITLDNPIHGVTVSAARAGENVTIAIREFTSTEDGALFMRRLEVLCNQLLNKLPKDKPIYPSQIDHMLAVIRRDGVVTVYINELPFLLNVRLKRAMNLGDEISDDDIAKVESLDLQNVSIPDDAGLLFVFSIGWRKGLFFDFASLQVDANPREYNLGTLLGHYWSYLAYQERFKVTSEQWQQLFNQQWFLFISLKSTTIREILGHIESQWLVDELLPNISAEVVEMLPEMLIRWEKNSILQSHLEFFHRAAERYLAKDFLSSSSILYPRIEGIMRNIHTIAGVSGRATAHNLIESVIYPAKSQEDNGYKFSVLLPIAFGKYLEEVYFRNFDTGQAVVISRHSIAHGVADAKEFSLKAATLGLLIVDQLFFFLPT